MMDVKNRIYWKGGYKYQLHKDYCHQLPLIFYTVAPFQSDFFHFTHPFLTIKKGYCWDGPSGPTIDSGDFMRASLVHDVLYQAMRERKLSEEFRDDADAEMKRICLEDGMGAIRAAYTYRAVRIFGDDSIEESEIKKVECYPPLIEKKMVRTF